MTTLVLVRFALYADLGLAFGVAAAAILTRVPSGLARLRPHLAGTIAIGLPLSLLGYLLTVAEMAGTGFADLDWRLAGTLATSTAVGLAFLVRITALAIAAGGCVAASRTRIWWIVSCGGALATLAWSGHAADGEGVLGLARLAGDVAHLLAASIWIGALVLFLALLWRPTEPSDESASALARFAGIGGVLVAVLGLTGLANIGFIARANGWVALIRSDYGLLLADKLALFSGMLGLAALNRFVLVPRLSASIRQGHPSLPLRFLRFSIAAEFLAAMTILLVVSRLGSLDPGSV